VFPMNQIRTGGMRPVHIAPHRRFGVVLMKHVIATVIKDGAVRVVHPVVRGEQVKLRAQRIGRELLAQRSIFGIYRKSPNMYGTERRSRRKPQKFPP